MALTAKIILTHVTGAEDIILLADGAKFVIVDGSRRSKVVSANDAAAFVKELTGIKTAIKIAKLKIGRSIPASDLIISLLSADSTIDDEISYQILSTTISAKTLKVWPLTVMNEKEVIELPDGVIDDVVAYLLANGVAKAPTAGLYDKIEFVDALPATVDEEENPIAIPATTAFVLNKADGDKPADSAWMFDGEWTELTDEGAVGSAPTIQEPEEEEEP